MELNLKMFICQGYTGRGANDMNVNCNGWKQEEKWLVVEGNALR
jgi:hypothetical protein